MAKHKRQEYKENLRISRDGHQHRRIMPEKLGDEGSVIIVDGGD
jgi:hypothetical protein